MPCIIQFWYTEILLHIHSLVGQVTTLKKAHDCGSNQGL